MFSQNSSHPLSIDLVQFEATRKLAGEKFHLLLGFFLEDATLYLAQLKEAMLEPRVEEIARLAHTLKSSAKQFGLTEMAEPARLLEEAARLHLLTPTTEGHQLASLGDHLFHAFGHVRPGLHRLLEIPASD